MGKWSFVPAAQDCDESHWLGKGGRIAKHAVFILVFSYKPTPNPRSEHTGEVKIWIKSAFLKLMNNVLSVCMEDGGLRLCHSLCWGGQLGFLHVGLTQTVAFYWAVVITRAKKLRYLRTATKCIWVTQRSCELSPSLPSVVSDPSPLGKNPEGQSSPGGLSQQVEKENHGSPCLGL